jgi:branched-subunit amino acid aminotransferase/4-amino-4-deoxychorismate lyase
MQKELNPELFGEKKSATPARREGMIPSAPSTDPVHLNTDRQIFEIKNQLLSMNDQLKQLTQAMTESNKTTNGKLERNQQHMSRLETSHNGLAVETGQKLQQINTKLAERKALDLKIQEMVDRHNNVIKSFEVRLNHMQKLLAEKEAMAAAAQTALNEAKMEIARLKRF